MFKREKRESQPGVEMYFDLGSNREERKFKIDKQGKP